MIGKFYLFPTYNPTISFLFSPIFWKEYITAACFKVANFQIKNSQTIWLRGVSVRVTNGL